MNLYCTADSIGTPTGGGAVTFHESEALKSLDHGWCIVDRSLFNSQSIQGTFVSRDDTQEPWYWDAIAKSFCQQQTLCSGFIKKRYDLAHFYAGTFSSCVRVLKEQGCKVTYTAAAHDVEASRREHERLGIPYNYPHLTDPELWKRYLAGYLAADVLICPSTHSRDVMRGFGCTNRIEVIPHGCAIPERTSELPDRFTVGYLGAVGPDKGLIYLLQAWKKLNYKDATLVIAGRDSTSDFMLQLCQVFGGGNIQLRGWVDNVSDFYNSISLYVQPSVTEGFGIEVLEAMAHGRPVICSTGAGACDLLDEFKPYSTRSVEPCNVDDLVDAIDMCRTLGYSLMKKDHEGLAYSFAPKYTWDKIRERYVKLWKELLA